MCPIKKEGKLSIIFYREKATVADIIKEQDNLTRQLHMLQ